MCRKLLLEVTLRISTEFREAIGMTEVICPSLILRMAGGIVG